MHIYIERERERDKYVYTILYYMMLYILALYFYDRRTSCKHAQSVISSLLGSCICLAQTLATLATSYVSW